MAVTVTRAVVSSMAFEDSVRVAFSSPHAISPHAGYPRIRHFAVGTSDAMAAKSAMSIVSNAYWDGSAWKLIANGRATAFNTESGALNYYGSNSGSAGDSVTFNLYLSVLDDGAIAIADGISAPATVAGRALFYVDSADGDYKVKFGDGTVKTIATDT
jgi:hypothetical protein